MDILTTTTVRTEKRQRINLGFTEIRRLLEREGITLPFGATITIDVPGGGDWSNTSLDVNDQRPVVVSWVEITNA